MADLPATNEQPERNAVEAPEIHAPHAHGGRHWLDKVVALAALVTSVVSIIVAVHHGETMEKLVEAQSWPYIGLVSSNVADDKAILSLTLRSAGSGPARLRTLSVRYAGKPVDDWQALLRACCATRPDIDDAALDRETDRVVVNGNPRGAVLLPGENTPILLLPRTSANAVLWEKLNERRGGMGFEACYCSVFDECYRTDFGRAGPHHVERCEPGNHEWGG